MLLLPASARFRVVLRFFLALNVLLLASCSNPNEYEGLWLRTYYGFNQLQTDTVYFHGDQIAWNPKGGVDPFDFDAAKKDAPGMIGTFKVNGSQMEIAWGGDRGKQSLKIEREKGRMSALDGGLVSKVGAYSKDERMDKTFGGVITAGGTNGVTAGRSITFTKGGTFSMSTLGTAELNPNVPGGTGSVSADFSGTYSLSGNTLTLKYANGKAEKHTVFPYSTALDPAKAELGDEKLFYDSMMLRREK